ncbi:SDR family NAD(P)-dependent oxidoreductase [Novosphingobium sp. G106]|uniref:SDR family NAD(P)-dependent oxidoreductase n=1 Tax=Novosphingobium sp. G106 TaxID=2849500 RepID=UPI0028116252|nr:SDR family NAD(P)-dependent oxidoreductase [Novosphingobium sp. G106]
MTGGAAGIGRAIALRLVHDGASVAIIDRDATSLATTRDLVLQHGRCAGAFAADLTVSDQLEAVFEYIRRDAGNADILVNNIGGSSRGSAEFFQESDLSSLERLIDLNLFSAVRATREVIRGMIGERWGRIINISSEAAFTAGSRNWDYGAAKAGVIGFTRAIAREMAEYGITANAVGPGLTRTATFDALVPELRAQALAASPMGPAEPEDIAHAVAFFASIEAGHVTGQTLLVNGGSWML